MTRSHITVPTQASWALLRTIVRSPGPFVPPTARVKKACIEMAAPGWDPTGWGPWLERTRTGAYILSGVERDGDASTGGHGAWREALSDRGGSPFESDWIDEALTGITATGHRSKITWAAIPKGGRHHG